MERGLAPAQHFVVMTMHSETRCDGQQSGEMPRVQDLRAFRLPPNFRGRPAWMVQLWWLVQATLFRLSPQICYGWRRFLLRLFGCKAGQGVRVRPTAEITYPWKVSIGDWSWIGDRVTLYSLGNIEIGDNVVVSQCVIWLAIGFILTRGAF